VTERPVKIVNDLGFHARAAARFVAEANRFSSQIYIIRNGEKVEGKSILGILALAAPRGTELTLQATGSDEQDAVDALSELIADRFGEER
jgi:phosphocarrier protein HPr